MIIGFRTAQMHFLIGGEMISLLKEDISANLGFLESAEFLNGQRCHFGVDPADLPGPCTDAINGLDGIQDIIQAILGIGFSCNEQNPFVSISDEITDLFSNLFLAERSPLNAFVWHTKGAILAVILAEIR